MGTVQPLKHDHVAQFYDEDDVLSGAVSGYLLDGIVAGEPVVIVAAPSRIASITRHFAVAGRDFTADVASGSITCVDAAGALQRFMQGELPDPEQFRNSIGKLMQERVGSSRSPVRAYGEMVDLLWQEGRFAGAMQLENLWNELPVSQPFKLMCSYPTSRQTRVYAAGATDRRSPHAQPAAIAPLKVELTLRGTLEDDLRSALADRLHIEQELQAARREADHANDAQSRFLAVMSHELRTPLNAILGYDDLLAKEIGGPTTEAQKLYIARIRSGAEQLAQLIDQILCLARLEAGGEKIETSPVDVVALAAEVAALVEGIARAAGLELVTDLPGEACVVETDAARLRQILLNLLSNAVKFTPSGFVALRARLSDADVIFEVVDSGMGISVEDQARVFEPFMQVDLSPTRRHGGSGLGLSVSRHLAALLGGSISLASTPGSGSTFTLRIPRASACVTVTV